VLVIGAPTLTGGSARRAGIAAPRRAAAARTALRHTVNGEH
jgi:hypothetical protein